MEAMFPVEKKADCRRKRKNRAGRMSDRFRVRYVVGWLFEGETEEETGVSVEATIWVDTSPRIVASGGLDVGVREGGFG